MKPLQSSIFAIGAYTILLSAVQLRAAEPATEMAAIMPEKHFAVFEKYCLDCHDSLTEKGELDLEEITFTLTENIQTAETWNKILNSINSGEMPPKDKKQIGTSEKIEFLGDLSEKMVLARSILSDSGGVIPLRRLNRREYANTLEDLLGVRPDVSLLPDDQASSEFDTMGGSLFFSSDQLEQYLATARTTLETALFMNQRAKPEVVRIEPEEHYNAHYLEHAKDLLDRAQRTYSWRATGEGDAGAKKFGYLDGYQAERQLNSFEKYFPQVQKYLAARENQTGVALMQTIKEGNTQIKLPKLSWNQGGKHTIRVRAGAYEDDPSRFHYLEFVRRVGQNTERLGWRKVTGTLKKPQIIEFTIDHPERMSAIYMVNKRTHEDRGDKNLWMVYREENGYGTPWGIWVDWAEREGPFLDQEATSPVDTILFKKPEKMPDSEYAKEVIRRFADRAFRGESADPAFLKGLFAIYEKELKEGGDSQRALMEPLAILLSTPTFLYLNTPAGEGDPERLSEHQLAVRLSYFLWSSPPDEELMSLAGEGKLSDPKVLALQVDRLLEDPRSENFVQSFAYQWLEMHRLGMFSFEGTQFPEFDNAVRDSAREEIYQTIRTVIDEKLPLGNLLKSDFIVINDVLADYYGIEGVKGAAFRKVQVPAESSRGGLLGTAAVMAMGSDGLRSSPVERGAWVLRHLLNNPPPPAPPNVPQLSRLEDEVLSARELQKAHQEEAQCAQCHRKIDPIGYGLENFDASGSWRETEVVVSGKRRTKKTEFPIDPGGELTDGTQFKSFFELRDTIADRSDAFAMGLTESLITYGLGRSFGFSDHQLAHDIVSDTAEDGYPISQMIHALVQSKTFQTR